MEAIRHEATSSRAPILLEDLSGPLEVLLLCVYFIVFYFVRRRGLSVAVLAHGLSMAFLVGTLGHYIEKHWLGLDGIRELLQPHEISMHFWTSLVVGAMLLSTIAVQLHKDKMLEGEIAQPYRFVFFASAATLYSATGARLNSLLGGSAINPAGGGYFLKVLRSPPMVAAILVTAGLSVWLYATLTRAEMEGQWEAVHRHHHQQHYAYSTPAAQATEALHRAAAAAQQAQAAEIQQQQAVAAWQQQQQLEQQQQQLLQQQQQEAEAAAAQQQLLAWQAAQQQQAAIIHQQLEWQQRQQVDWHKQQQHEAADWQHQQQQAAAAQLAAHHEPAPVPYPHACSAASTPTYASSHASGAAAYSGPIETMPMPSSSASSSFHRSSSDIIMATKTPSSTTSSPYASSDSQSSSSCWGSDEDDEEEEEEREGGGGRGRSRLAQRSFGGHGESGYASNSDSGGSRQRRRPRRAHSEGRQHGRTRHHHRQQHRRVEAAASVEQQWEAWQAETQAAQQWVECYDEGHGRPYYFNQGTGETSWSKPWAYEAAAAMFGAADDAHTKHE